MDVSDRRMQVQLTQEAKIVSDFYSIRAIFAFVGFVSALCFHKSVEAISRTCPGREGVPPRARVRSQMSMPATAMLVSVHTPSLWRKP